MRPQQLTEYREYAAARMEKMRHFAYLNCGNWHRAEDAVQTSFVKLYVAWPRAVRIGIDAYTRRIIINTLIDESRRGWFHREKPHQWLPEQSTPANDPTDRINVLNALARLPARRRATVILRYWEDLSVEQTARIMRCSPNTVKTQSTRGLQTLRELLSDSIHEPV